MRSFLVVALVAAGSCAEVTAADYAPVTVTLTAKAASAACVFADPEPASVRQDQGIAFANKSSVQITIVLVEDDKPLVTVPAGAESGAIKFRNEGIHQYYSLGCGSALSERHTLAVTVN
ncbi:MAG TPA: hypothetical protein VKH19_08415 [Gemmatimonadaceae bacterium]|nr:hypothetical protein [Gemmatimonadaceae bacterium]